MVLLMWFDDKSFAAEEGAEELGWIIVVRARVYK